MKLAPLLRWLAALLAVAAALSLIFRPDPRDQLRAAERLFVAGRYHEALAAYGPLAPRLDRLHPAALPCGVGDVFLDRTDGDRFEALLDDAVAL
ncbi:MAG: hypothetical protein HGA45_44160, partial [Chloroflexales bacterium]|nr:hypothetical protein [Chloroflexales bacterium]